MAKRGIGAQHRLDLGSPKNLGWDTALVQHARQVDRLSLTPEGGPIEEPDLDSVACTCTQARDLIQPSGLEGWGQECDRIAI